MAKIYYISHETPIKEFKMSIIKKDGVICFPATILKRHPNDIVISVKPYLFWNDIIIPQGAVWLRKLLLDHKNTKIPPNINREMHSSD
jgi:hypothetical protein